MSLIYRECSKRFPWAWLAAVAGAVALGWVLTEWVSLILITLHFDP
jgi:hypothetical protein